MEASNATRRVFLDGRSKITSEFAEPALDFAESFLKFVDHVCSHHSRA